MVTPADRGKGDEDPTIGISALESAAKALTRLTSLKRSELRWLGTATVEPLSDRDGCIIGSLSTSSGRHLIDT